MVERDGQWTAGMGRRQTKKPWNGSMPTQYFWIIDQLKLGSSFCFRCLKDLVIARDVLFPK